MTLPRPPISFALQLLLLVWLLARGACAWALPVVFVMGSNFGIAVQTATARRRAGKGR